MIAIKFDLDGVIRDLSGFMKERYNYDIVTWKWRHNDKDIYDYINEDPSILLNAKPTEYYNVIKELDNIVIWTRQPDDWIPNTVKWVKKYLPKASIRFFGGNEDKEESIYKENVIIVEDYPVFKNYSNIILIDRPYNQNVQTGTRVKTPDGLYTLLKTLEWRNGH